MDHTLYHISDLFTPHGHCMLWTPPLVGMHTVSDGMIALAYTMIPFMLGYLAYKRRDLPYNPVFWMFASFIILCGSTHVMAMWNMWHTDYYLEGLIKVATAIVSLGTAFMLVPLVPQILRLRSLDEANKLNESLQRTVAVLTAEYEQRCADNAAIDEQSLTELRSTVQRLKDFAGS